MRFFCTSPLDSTTSKPIKGDAKSEEKSEKKNQFFFGRILSIGTIHLSTKIACWPYLISISLNMYEFYILIKIKTQLDLKKNTFFCRELCTYLYTLRY